MKPINRRTAIKTVLKGVTVLTTATLGLNATNEQLEATNEAYRSDIFLNDTPDQPPRHMWSYNGTDTPDFYDRMTGNKVTAQEVRLHELSQRG